MPNVPAFLGALERKLDPRDLLLGTVPAAAIPPQFLPDMSWFTRNFQGQTPFCGEHAGTHLKAILDFFGNGGTPRKNPRYGAIKLKTPSSPVYDGFPIEAGTDMRAIFQWLQKVGADDFEPLENDVTLPAATYCDPSVVTPVMDTDAAQSKIASYAFGATDFASLCQYIYQFKAVLLLIKCDDGFWGTATPTFTNPTYGHFVVGYGYDENGIHVIDSAEPDNALALKYIVKQFITPTFFTESGTAIDLPPSAVTVLQSPFIPASDKPALIQLIITDIKAAVALIQKEL